MNTSEMFFTREDDIESVCSEDEEYESEYESDYGSLDEYEEELEAERRRIRTPGSESSDEI